MYVQKERKARKDHICEKCGNTIPKKTKYLQITVSENFVPLTYHYCLKCANTIRK